MTQLSGIVRRVRHFFLPGAEEAFAKIEELAGLGEEALTLLVKILSAPRNGNGLTEVSFCTEKISALEKDGDVLTEALEEKLGRRSIARFLIKQLHDLH